MSESSNFPTDAALALSICEKIQQDSIGVGYTYIDVRVDLTDDEVAFLTKDDDG